jgi:cytochrome c oxidase assembly factor 1
VLIIDGASLSCRSGLRVTFLTDRYKPETNMAFRILRSTSRPRPVPLFSHYSRHCRRTLIPAPSPNSGPLLDRRSDRELPQVESSWRWARTLPLFAVLVGAAMFGIFNYQKSSSSVVSSTLYALRTSPRAREILGDEIYFAHKIPWINGEIDQLHGRIDISFWVKGTKSKGKMRFRSVRPNRMSYVSPDP